MKEAHVGFGYVPALLRGSVPATLGGFWSYDALALAAAHRQPLVVPVSQAGIPSYDELLLVVRTSEAERDGENLRAFLHALTHGQQAVKASPAAASASLVQANAGLPPKLQRESIEHTLTVSYPANASDPFGFQEPATWEAFAQWMFKNGMLHRDPGNACAALHERVPARPGALTRRRHGRGYLPGRPSRWTSSSSERVPTIWRRSPRPSTRAQARTPARRAERSRAAAAHEADDGGPSGERAGGDSRDHRGGHGTLGAHERLRARTNRHDLGERDGKLTHASECRPARGRSYTR